ncbi:hypothetical protein FOZ60_017098 [Perkinsus olseni]|uniref:Uncharacterized protein n=1 Tax=Perkinsus olseni TaxID=32597 RepID=A0A7J6N383_PEROL|nr:hypothetical protein FOZ60_017098 [Perkinsus olseni]
MTRLCDRVLFGINGVEIDLKNFKAGLPELFRVKEGRHSCRVIKSLALTKDSFGFQMDLQRYHHAATSSEGADQTSATERQLRLLMAKEMVRRREVEQACDRLMNKIATEMATEMMTEMALEMAARKASEMAVEVASEIPWVAKALELARAKTEIDELTRKLKKSEGGMFERP